jgi:hypothetical protein
MNVFPSVNLGNLGTMERIRVVDAAAMILRHMGESAAQILAAYAHGSIQPSRGQSIGQRTHWLGTPGSILRTDRENNLLVCENRDPDEVRSQLQSMLTER